MFPYLFNHKSEHGVGFALLAVAQLLLAVVIRLQTNAPAVLHLIHEYCVKAVLGRKEVFVFFMPVAGAHIGVGVAQIKVQVVIAELQVGLNALCVDMSVDVRHAVESVFAGGHEQRRVDTGVEEQLVGQS